MSFHGKLYLPLLFALTGLLGGCHSAVLGDYPADCPDAAPKLVRITTTLNRMGAPGGDVLKAMKEDLPPSSETPPSTFDPKTVPGSEFENRVNHLLLLVFDKTASESDAPVYSSIYYNDTPSNASFPSGVSATEIGGVKIKRFGAESKSTLTQSQGGQTALTFDLVLAPGNYYFFLIVNDLNIENAIKGVSGAKPLPKSIADLKSYPLTLPGNRALVSAKELSALPMFGEQVIDIPNNGPDLYHATPEIDLERILAKFDFRLTNASQDPVTSELVFLNSTREYSYTPYSYDEAQKTGGCFLRLRDRVNRIKKGTPFLPMAGEYTVSGSVKDAVLATRPDFLKSKAAYYPATSPSGDPSQIPSEDQMELIDFTSAYSDGVAQTKDGQKVFFMAPVIDEAPVAMVDGAGGFAKGETMTYYIAPFSLYDPATKVYDAEEEDMPNFTFGYKTEGGTYLDDDGTAYDGPSYTVSVFNDVSNLSDHSLERFTVARNTIYRFNAKLIGQKILISLDLLHEAHDFEKVPDADVPVFN
ncbi:MAG: hypothetical protein MR609_02890 [Bacteroidales bacterium]|nr:hypothetical protein [Bacteroidales bacterium]